MKTLNQRIYLGVCLPDANTTGILGVLAVLGG